jgi:hypothetical protein
MFSNQGKSEVLDTQLLFLICTSFNLESRGALTALHMAMESPTLEDFSWLGIFKFDLSRIRFQTSFGGGNLRVK